MRGGLTDSDGLFFGGGVKVFRICQADQTKWVMRRILKTPPLEEEILESVALAASKRPQEAADLRLRAERRAGEMLIEMGEKKERHWIDRRPCRSLCHA